MENLEGVCRGRAGQGRQEGCPWLGKKGSSAVAFYFCVSCPAVSLCPGISTTAQAAALTRQTNEQKERSLLPSARFWLKCEQEMKSLSSLQRPVSLQLMLNSTESR